MNPMPVVCLMGPTASGKTAVAMQLADAYPMDIVSVDSALVYRGMDIGTAKPDGDELSRYPHQLIDIRDPEETYSAGDFVRDANAQIDVIQSANRTPLLVGGTMMYFRAIIDGMADLPSADASVRAAIDGEARELGWATMHKQLAQIDAPSAQRINPNDPQRIQRALEVYRVSGRSLSSWQSATSPGRHTFLKFALLPEPRSELHSRIEKRLDKMLATGFINEIKKLMEHPDLTKDHASMRAVGYRQFWSSLSGECKHEDARQKALAATRQLAKRQLTWLRAEQNVIRINPLELDAFESISSHLNAQ